MQKPCRSPDVIDQEKRLRVAGFPDRVLRRQFCPGGVMMLFLPETDG
jgi:hypothetical protein